MIKVVFIGASILIMLVSVIAQAKVYKYVDEHGQVHYSEKKPVNMKSKRLDVHTERKRPSGKKIKILATKDLDKAVREGKITEAIAIRMRHFNYVSKEYFLMKKKKRAMKLAISSAKSTQSETSAGQVKHLKKLYDEFVKEDFYYVRRNFLVSRKKIRAFLDSRSKKTPDSLVRKKQIKNGVVLEWR